VIAPSKHPAAAQWPTLDGRERRTITAMDPSPRNQPWLKRHPWFERQVLPALQECVQSLVAA
jgi:uracil-DNA glycosylase